MHAAILLAAWVAMPVFAQSLPRTGYGVASSGDYLARMDADRDGRVALVEYQDWLSYAFDAMDRDRDSVLSPAEQPGGRGSPITREQHRARLAERFRKQDGNGDGYLGVKELAAPPR